MRAVRHVLPETVLRFAAHLLDMPENDRRKAAVPRQIAEIDAEDDVRVRVLGTVLEVRDDSVMLDDGSGTVEVFLDADDLDAVEESQRVRVFGRVLPTPDAFEIQGEILQDMSDLDMELYGRVVDRVGRERIP